MAPETTNFGTALVGGEPLLVEQRDGALLALDVARGVSLRELVARGELPRAQPGAAPLADARLTAPLRPGKIVATCGVLAARHPLVGAGCGR